MAVKLKKGESNGRNFFRLVIFFWFFKNKPEGEVDTAAELFNTPQGLMTRKGRMTVVLVALSFLAVGALLLWVAIN